MRNADGDGTVGLISSGGRLSKTPHSSCHAVALLENTGCSRAMDSMRIPDSETWSASSAHVRAPQASAASPSSWVLSQAVCSQGTCLLGASCRWKPVRPPHSHDGPFQGFADFRQYRLVCSRLARAVTNHGVLSCHNIWMHGCAGTMCYKHWRDKRLNPSGFRVVSREYPHEPVAMYKDLRCASPYSCRANASQNAVLLGVHLS